MENMQKVIANLEENSKTETSKAEYETQDNSEHLECEPCEDGGQGEMVMSKLFSMLQGYGKSKGKGKWSKPKFDGLCSKCGKHGHKAAECWSSGNQHKGKGHGKNTGNYGKGWNYNNNKGKGKGNYGLNM